MNPLFSVFGIRNTIANFDTNVAANGWVKGNRQLLADLNIRYVSDLTQIPKGGVLVFANHPTGLDPFILSAVGGRENALCLCDVYQTQKGRHIAKHIIPVYFSSLVDFIYKPFTSWPGFFIMRMTVGRVNKSQARAHNDQALAAVVAALKKGKTVYMFPSGGEVPSRPWKSGLGKIIKRAYQDRINFNLYKVHISGLSELGLIWHFITGRRFYSGHPIAVTGRLVHLPNTLDLDISSYDLAQYLKTV